MGAAGFGRSFAESPCPIVRCCLSMLPLPKGAYQGFILVFDEKLTKISEDDLRKTRRRAAWLTPSKDDNAVLHKSDRKDCEVLIEE